MQICVHVKEIREQKNMTIAALSRKSGVSASTIFDIENGFAIPRIDTLCKLAEALGMPCSKLFSCFD